MAVTWATCSNARLLAVRGCCPLGRKPIMPVRTPLPLPGTVGLSHSLSHHPPEEHAGHAEHGHDGQHLGARAGATRHVC